MYGAKEVFAVYELQTCICLCRAGHLSFAVTRDHRRANAQPELLASMGDGGCRDARDVDTGRERYAWRYDFGTKTTPTPPSSQRIGWPKVHVPTPPQPPLPSAEARAHTQWATDGGEERAQGPGGVHARRAAPLRQRVLAVVGARHPRPPACHRTTARTPRSSHPPARPATRFRA